MFYYRTSIKTILTFLFITGSFACAIGQTAHNYTDVEQEDLTTKHESTTQVEHHEELTSHEGKHHKYELEISYSNSGHWEFTGSIYFAHLTKFQGTVEFTGKHFASVVVREIPIGHSKWGTFVGVGGTFGYHDSHDFTDEHYIDVDVEDITHPDDVPVEDGNHREWGGAVIVQTGLAYSLNNHWSTGFTLSPGIDVHTHQPTFGATLDLVFGF
ncbi:hypothetical protein KMW28_14675 [Flammeovirga yaeyamensis]|uniref:Outer membrane protein beta-barrel domain-containing protein n=1 Tax=Flammeovirga yaeyamensis TaxID=367791 RepID=A0AAX1N3D2_9BACT|nr:hypothetical protein [Flammeovirga yaeyamensis]MBB3700163.1 hypothetical protein [Flammeovirga yaeyamensis]NMF37207.1 hypothetical protein [Flammeovirga yaeyamensis]QWG00896.1 hypothetical protein KMW28_14675 [Flammeovirga yaeyamensis]